LLAEVLTVRAVTDHGHFWIFLDRFLEYGQNHESKPNQLML
jgi:hypothetical protein